MQIPAGSKLRLVVATKKSIEHLRLRRVDDSRGSDLRFVSTGHLCERRISRLRLDPVSASVPRLTLPAGETRANRPVR